MACESVENDWKPLSVQMDASHVKQCEILCMQQRENGCCFLEDGVGCYWLKDSYAIEETLEAGIATTCYNVGEFWTPTNRLLLFIKSIQRK